VAARESFARWHRRTDAVEHLRCNRRFVQFMQIDELAPDVRPTRSFAYPAAVVEF